MNHPADQRSDCGRCKAQCGGLYDDEAGGRCVTCAEKAKERAVVITEDDGEIEVTT